MLSTAELCAQDNIGAKYSNPGIDFSFCTPLLTHNHGKDDNILQRT